MTRQLATMVTSGLSLLQALHVLEEQTERRQLEDRADGVRQDVEAGRSLSEAMAEHPKVFSTVYVAMVNAGETGGFLEDSLERVADQLESDEVAAPRGQVGDGLPDRRDLLRDGDHDRDDRVHRPRVRRRSSRTRARRCRS